MPRQRRESLSVVGLFAGIGGIELGLSRAGHQTRMLCEIEPGARAVLRSQFKTEVEPDIRALGDFPDVDLIAGGFPCQDLSQAGRTAGIGGEQSGLVGEVFKRLIHRGPRWLMLENVPFMLQLQRGRAMRYLVDELERLGFTWAYRVVDARSFGIPQRRQRVLLLASRTEDPRPVLFGADAGELTPAFSKDRLCGFYWTEGLRGLGWAVDAVPTLKGGSTIGIPSPPAIWDPTDRSITTPDLRDAERLQDLPADWTRPAIDVPGIRSGHRWKLVGNAVNAAVAQWMGERLVDHARVSLPKEVALQTGVSWPRAAWGTRGKVFAVDCSAWPVRTRAIPLRDFLRYPRKPLSERAAKGFLNRASVSNLRFQDGFLEDIKRHVQRMSRNLFAA